MGACVSTSNRPSKSRKYYIISKKHKGKVSAAVSDSPETLNSDGRNHFAVRKCDRVETAATNRRQSEVSNLTVHLTQLQWRHSHIDRNGMILVQCNKSDSTVISQEEARLDSASILDSDSDDDFNSVRGDGFLPVSNAVGAQMLQCKNASRFVGAGCKYEECGDNTPIALVVEEYLKREEGKTETVLNQVEGKESDKSFNSNVEAKPRALHRHVS